MKKLDKKTTRVLIITFFLESILFMYFMPFGSFNPKEFGFYLCILTALISKLLFSLIFGRYLEYRKKQSS